MKRKGIILAGGTGSRLHPSTISVSKQLMPVFDKPMIYYPLTVLMEAGLDDILIITTPEDQAAFKKLLKDGRQWGLNIDYAVQPAPEGLAQALVIAKDWLAGAPSALILGDNLFFGQSFSDAVRAATLKSKGATVFGYRVRKPARYGVLGFNAVIAFNQGRIDAAQLRALAAPLEKSGYGKYLLKVLEAHDRL